VKKTQEELFNNNISLTGNGRVEELGNKRNKGNMDTYPGYLLFPGLSYPVL
jgi:hypothetical protein